MILSNVHTLINNFILPNTIYILYNYNLDNFSLFVTQESRPKNVVMPCNFKL